MGPHLEYNTERGGRNNTTLVLCYWKLQAILSFIKLHWVRSKERSSVKLRSAWCLETSLNFGIIKGSVRDDISSGSEKRNLCCLSPIGLLLLRWSTISWLIIDNELIDWYCVGYKPPSACLTTLLFTCYSIKLGEVRPNLHECCIFVALCQN